MNGIGERLNLLRKERGMSLDELGDKLGMPKSSLSRYEGNLSDPSIEAVKKIAKFFNVSIDWLTGDTDIRDVNKFDINKYKESKAILEKCKDSNLTLDSLCKIIDALKGVNP